jgi:hypothetical protein
MKTLIRLARHLLRRPAPAYRGWQDFELGKYVTDPVPAERVKYVDIMPDLSRWQEEMLKHQVWGLRHRLLQDSLRPEDFTVALRPDGPPRPHPVPLTIFGIPVRLDANVPRGTIRLESKPHFQPAPPADRALLLSGLPTFAGLGTHVVIPPGNTDAEWKPLSVSPASVPPHEYRRDGRKVEIRRCMPDLPLGLYDGGDWT